MSTAIKPRPEFAGILQHVDKFGTGQNRDAADCINTAFDLLIQQSGVDIAPSLLLLSSLDSGLALGGLAFVVHENLLSTALAILGGFLLPITIVIALRFRRQRRIASQIPEMLNELTRAVRTGGSIDDGLRQAGGAPGPLGRELKRVAQRIDFGLSLADALHDLPQRTGVDATRAFTAALIELQQTGSEPTIL
ncbi:MAG: type II secretion system F family protein [Planctomycetaceae bacterium]